jgi:anti-sigma factor ChrR (cupin superfamily)
MAFYSYQDPDFFDAITSPALRWRKGAGPTTGTPMDIGSILLGDESSAPKATLLQLPAGGVLPRHAHMCWRCEVVVHGSIEVADGRVLGPGDVMISPPGEMYGPHTAGPDGSLTVEIFSQADAAHRFADPDLQARYDAWEAEHSPHLS